MPAKAELEGGGGGWRNPRFGWSLGWTSQRTATLVEVTTQNGMTGWGDGAAAEEVPRAHPEVLIGRSECGQTNRLAERIPDRGLEAAATRGSGASCVLAKAAV